METLETFLEVQKHYPLVTFGAFEDIGKNGQAWQVSFFSENILNISPM